MSKREVIGGLSIIVVLFLIFTGINTYYSHRNESTITDSDPALTEEIIVKHETAESYRQQENKKTYQKFENKRPDFQLHNFDPNTVSKNQMEAMGFPASLITNIENYRSKGGQFYQKEDLQRLYAFREEWYPLMAPFIQIQKAKASYTKRDKKTYPKYKKKTYEPIDLNTATAEQLDKQWGVSPKVAANIVKFRDKLGGFYTADQVREVYTLPDSVYEHNKDLWSVSNPQIRKININTASYDELNAQPYIRKYRYAKLILNYRKKHGKFTSLDDLTKIRGIESSTLNRIKPYLKL